MLAFHKKIPNSIREVEVMVDQKLHIWASRTYGERNLNSSDIVHHSTKHIPSVTTFFMRILSVALLVMFLMPKYFKYTIIIWNLDMRVDKGMQTLYLDYCMKYVFIKHQIEMR